MRKHRNPHLSGKQKAEQLKEKRARKRGDKQQDATDDEETETRGPLDGIVQESLGRSGAVHKWSTIFAKEEGETVQARRNAGAAPLNMALRGLPIVAPMPHPSDPVLQHPKGVVLRAGALVRAEKAAGRCDTTFSEAKLAAMKAEEDADFKAWLERIYEKYPRGRLNYFEHNQEVWMQLWHTVATADVIAIVADARNPLWHLPRSLVRQITEELGKPLVVVVNKSDLIPPALLETWLAYLDRAYNGPGRTSASTPVRFVPFTASGADLSSAVRQAERRRCIREARAARDGAHVGRRYLLSSLVLSYRPWSYTKLRERSVNARALPYPIFLQAGVCGGVADGRGCDCVSAGRGSGRDTGHPSPAYDRAPRLRRGGRARLQLRGRGRR